jgi:AcrR family transcriptional regulator
MPRKERQRRPPRHETQRQLVDAAARVVAKAGFRGATVEAITSEAGLTSGALYSNFKTKEDLFLRLFEERIRNRNTDLRSIIEAAPTAEEARDAAFKDEARLLADREFFLLYLEFVLYAARSRAFAKRFAAVRRQVLAERADAIRVGFERWGNPSDVDADFVVRAGSALTYGTALHHLIDRDEPAAADALATGMRYLFTGVVRSAERRRSRR